MVFALILWNFDPTQIYSEGFQKYLSLQLYLVWYQMHFW